MKTPPYWTRYMSKTNSSIFLVTMFFAMLGNSGCSDSRLNVYEFMEFQQEMNDVQFVQSPTNNHSEPKKSIVHRNTSGKPAVAQVQSKDLSENSSKGPVTPQGRWKFNDNTKMWTFVQDKPAAAKVRLASHGKADAGEPDELSDEAAGQQVMQQVYTEFHRPYRVGPSDILRVSMTGLTGVEMLTEPTEVLARVNRLGYINLPLVGSVKVGEREIEDVEQAIHDAYVPKFVASLGLSVELHEYSTTDVVVVGAALLPGIVKLNRCQRDVLHAVVLAGGMTQDASGTLVLQRIRNPRDKIELNVRNTNHLKTVLALDPLESGDVINVVAAQPNTVFVGGLVNNPGPKEFPQGTKINALQALAAGGGVIEAVLPTEATLIRRMQSGEDAFVRIDLEKTKQGRDPNIELAAGDILWVPETVGTRIMDFVNRTFFLRAGMTVTYNVTGLEFLNRRGLQGSRSAGGNNLQNTVDPLGFLAP